MPHERYVPKYDSDVAEEFETDGMSAQDATLVAATEMEGASETKSGGINARQTACKTLKYDEGCPESVGARIGEIKTTRNIRSEFSLEEDADVDKFVDDWIKQQETKLDK